jgi:hypothetical protein
MLDQLIINFEASYVPDRTLTNPSLSRDYVRKPEGAPPGHDQCELLRDARSALN